jgi:hypothetical protein
MSFIFRGKQGRSEGPPFPLSGPGCKYIAWWHCECIPCVQTMGALHLWDCGSCECNLCLCCECNVCAGIVNSLLSFRALLPLSRLTYCAYLTHPLIMVVTGFSMDGPLHLHNLLVVSLCSLLTIWIIIDFYVVNYKSLAKGVKKCPPFGIEKLGNKTNLCVFLT